MSVTTKDPEYIELDKLAAVVDQLRSGARPSEAELAGALENALNSIAVLTHVVQHVPLTEPCDRDGCAVGRDSAEVAQ